MLAYDARYDALDSGELPRAASGSAPVDVLDVADLESEQEHGYELGATRETENLALAYDDEGLEIADGARVGRRFDRFVLRGRSGTAYRLVGRFVVSSPLELAVEVGGAAVTKLSIAPGGWTETSFDIPANIAGPSMNVSIVDASGAGFGSAHYWLYER
jgi:hypothetical protein